MRSYLRPLRSPLPVFNLLAVWFLLAGTLPLRAEVVFSTDFEGGLPPEFLAPGSGIEGVQGFAGLGPVGRQFDGSFLRYTSVPLHDTKLTLTGLPPHDHLSLKFLLAVIDSWDGTELLQVFVDGELLFSHWFQIATGDTTSYFPAPPGAILSMGMNLGFSNGSYYARDRAYDLGVEPSFLHIPHTADSATAVWRLSAVSGPAADQWQGGSDESWAIDAVSVEVTSTVDVDGGPDRSFGIQSVQPNPAIGGQFTVHLTLERGERAGLELFDVAGRRVWRGNVGGALRQAVRLGSGIALQPGVYWLRLTEGARTDLSRVAVLR